MKAKTCALGFRGPYAPQCTVRYSYQTDVTRVSTGRGKSLYGQPSLGVVGDSQSSRSNDITLALPLCCKGFTPLVCRDQPRGVPSVDPSTLGGKILYNLATLV